MKKIVFICIIFSISINLHLIAQVKNDMLGENVFGEKEEKISNLTGYIYYLEDNPLKLPDFEKLKPVGEIYTSSININNQDFKIGFPGVTDRFENFAIDYKGEFYIEDSNIYNFILGSDDGSKLFIDEKLVIDNDYQHALVFKTGDIILSKGNHKIEVQYFQGPRYNVALILRYRKGAEKVFQVFDLTQLYPITVNEKSSSIDISIGDEVLFEFNSYDLNEVSLLALNDIKRLIIDKTKVKSIIIEGHTDDIGSEEYNMKLSINRANSVKEYLVNIGINPELIVTNGCGEIKPKVPNINNESRRKNRRIEIVIMKLEE
ncbi:MAG: OmpA family protein [Bacteroidales bacterium]|nr:OmpA family protein [Bacteroidales bacterium]